MYELGSSGASITARRSASPAPALGESVQPSHTAPRVFPLIYYCPFNVVAVVSVWSNVRAYMRKHALALFFYSPAVT